MRTKTFLMVDALCCGLISIANCTAFAAERKAVITGIQSPVDIVYNKDGALYVAELVAVRISRFCSDGKRTTVTDSISSTA